MHFIPFGALSYFFGSVNSVCPNISIAYASVQPVKDEFAIDDTATVSCISGYSLNGTDKFVCKTGDVWEPDTFPNCVGGKIDIDALRKKSRDGAWDQDYWINWDELGISSAFLTVLLIISLCVLAAGMAYLSYTLFSILVGSREERARKIAQKEREKEVQREREEARASREQQRKEREAMDTGIHEDEDVVGISFKMDAGANRWIIKTKQSVAAM